MKMPKEKIGVSMFAPLRKFSWTLKEQDYGTIFMFSFCKSRSCIKR